MKIKYAIAEVGGKSMGGVEDKFKVVSQKTEQNNKERENELEIRKEWAGILDNWGLIQGVQ